MAARDANSILIWLTDGNGQLQEFKIEAGAPGLRSVCSTSLSSSKQSDCRLLFPSYPIPPRSPPHACPQANQLCRDSPPPAPWAPLARFVQIDPDPALHFQALEYLVPGPTAICYPYVKSQPPPTGTPGTPTQAHHEKREERERGKEN